VVKFFMLLSARLQLEVNKGRELKLAGRVCPRIWVLTNKEVAYNFLNILLG
jgi:hypothetical protein